MSENSDKIMVQSMSRAKTKVKSAEKLIDELQSVITYLRSDHVGMIRGDGDLTRYMHYLVSKAGAMTKEASAEFRQGNVPDELPF